MYIYNLFGMFAFEVLDYAPQAYWVYLWEHDSMAWVYFYMPARRAKCILLWQWLLVFLLSWEKKNRLSWNLFWSCFESNQTQKGRKSCLSAFFVPYFAWGCCNWPSLIIFFRYLVWNFLWNFNNWFARHIFSNFQVFKKDVRFFYVTEGAP